MAYSTELLANAPIIVHSHEPGPDMVNEIPEAMRHMAELLNKQADPVYLVLNLQGVTMGLDDMMKTSSDATRGPGALLHHPKVSETIFIVSDNFMRMGIAGLNSEAFGHAKVRTFASLEAGLEYCYMRIAETAEH